MYGSKKGFTSTELFFKQIDLAAEILVKQILTPPLVAVSDQTYELPGGMQRKRPGPPGQLQPILFRGPVALPVVAAVAASHQIFPRRAAATRPRHHVVQRQFRTREDPPTELTRIPVAQQNILP